MTLPWNKMPPLPCGRLECHNLGTKVCAACRRIDYCSADCQKADWGVHKKCCVNINRKLLSFCICPKQVAAISQRLDIAEDYFSRNPKLELRLRVSNLFMKNVESLQDRMVDVFHEDKEIMRGLCIRLKNILGKVGDAVGSGRVCFDEVDYDPLKHFIVIHQHYFVYILRSYYSPEERVTILEEEALNLPQLSLLTNDSFRTTVVADILLVLHFLYLKAGALEKALEMTEKAYTVRSEFTGPNDAKLECITLHMCNALAKMGGEEHHERMMEYLTVVIDTMRNCPGAYEDDSGKSSSLCVRANTVRNCARSLPEGHPKRNDIFTYAYSMAVDFIEFRSKCAEKSPRIEFRSSLPVISTVCADPGIVIEVDYVRLLTALRHTYHVYLVSMREADTKVANDSVYGIVKEIAAVLVGILIKLEQKDLLVSCLSRKCWDELITPLIESLELLLHELSALITSSSYFDDEAQLKLGVVAAHRQGDVMKAVDFEILLVKMELQKYLQEVKLKAFDYLIDYHRALRRNDYWSKDC